MVEKDSWEVTFSNKAKKQRRKLPEKVRFSLDALVKEISLTGPIKKSWPNFSKLKDTKLIPKEAYHCHLKKG